MNMEQQNETKTHKVLRYLGLTQPRTRKGRVLRNIEGLIIAVGALYLLLLAWPQPIFRNTLQHAGIHVHSMDEIPPETSTLLQQVHERVSKSELYHPEMQYDIFICNSDWLYTVLAPRGRDGFGACFPITDNIFLSNVDLRNNISFAYREDFNDRPFVAVVAHEITHVLLRQETGLWGEQKAPTWLKEGYCEMIAGESSFPAVMGNILLAIGEKEGGGSFIYFKYRRMVEYLIQIEGRSIRELLADPPPHDEVLLRTQLWLRDRMTRQAKNKTAPSHVTAVGRQ